MNIWCESGNPNIFISKDIADDSDLYLDRQTKTKQNKLMSDMTLAMLSFVCKVFLHN